MDSKGKEEQIANSETPEEFIRKKAVELLPEKVTRISPADRQREFFNFFHFPASTFKPVGYEPDTVLAQNMLELETDATDDDLPNSYHVFEKNWQGKRVRIIAAGDPKYSPIVLEVTENIQDPKRTQTIYAIIVNPNQIEFRNKKLIWTVVKNGPDLPNSTIPIEYFKEVIAGINDLQPKINKQPRSQTT